MLRGAAARSAREDRSLGIACDTRPYVYITMFYYNYGPLETQRGEIRSDIAAHEQISGLHGAQASTCFSVVELDAKAPSSFVKVLHNSKIARSSPAWHLATS